MAKACKNDLKFSCTGIIKICHNPSPQLISIISSCWCSWTKFLLFFDCWLDLAQPFLEDLKWIFAHRMCWEMWKMVWLYFWAPMLTILPPTQLNSTLFNWNFTYIARKSIYTDKGAPIFRILWSIDVHLWVMVCQIGMGYGIWESLVHLAGHQLGGHEKVWAMGFYGLSQVWIRTEVTVLVFSVFKLP